MTSYAHNIFGISMNTNVQPKWITILTSLLLLAGYTSQSFGQLPVPFPRAPIPAPPADPNQPAKPFVGIFMVDVEDEGGISLTQIVEKGPAEIAGLQVNDIITKLGRVKITNIDSMRETLADYEIGESVVITYTRNGEEAKVELELGDSVTRLPAPKAKIVPRAFPSTDGLEITADLYIINKDKKTPFIVLCHQAGWSRGEYREIAPRLNRMGFNCMAIDQRSGGAVNNVTNLTHMKAVAQSQKPTFLDAEQDLISAVKWAKSRGQAEGKVILWGSSYSSALALRIAGEQPDLVDGVLAFAPGEYFERFEKPKDWITESAKKIQVPVFVTSAKDEATKWEAIFEAIPGEAKKKFVPETEGNHGSRALWRKFEDSAEYWENVTAFLEQFKE